MYLIAHKVRGQPGFDVAIRCDDMGTPSDPGPWWIIPTSGHRAYPIMFWTLDDVIEDMDKVGDHPNFARLREHYGWTR